MKILLTGRNFSNLKRGAHLIGNKFAELFPDKFDYIDQIHVRDWAKAVEGYKKIVFMSQNPRLYNTAPYITRIHKIPHTFYIRNEYAHPLINSCSNGFHYYQQFENIKHYIPRIMPPPECRLTALSTSDRPCIGFYLRAQLLTDSYQMFMQWIEDLKEEVDVCIMGEDVFDFSTYPHVKNYYHTFDNKEFFSKITHFVYFHSEWLDPFPHTLLEAVNLGLQVIIPNKGRPADLKDGIHDILDVADVHSKLDLNKTYDNSKCLLTFENLKPWYDEVFTHYSHSLPRNNHQTLLEFLEAQVLPLSS